MYARQKIKSKPFWRPRNFVLAGLILVVLACGMVGALEYTNTTYWFHKRPVTHETQKNTPTRTIDANTKGGNTPTSTSGTSNTQTNNQTTPQQDTKTETPTSSSATLVAPSGNFVNSHHVAANSAPNTQQSTCVTTPGATCEIIFTSGSVTKSLGVQTTDPGGAAYWTWSPQSAGLTVGTWKITAKAVLGNQTKTAVDANNLEVN